MSEFVKLLEEEVLRLQSELERTPAFAKWKAASDLLAVYKQRPSALQAFASYAQATNEANAAHAATRREPGARAAILEAAKAHIAGRTSPTSTLELLEAVQAQGVEVGGQEPRNNLSSLLSRSEEFVSHGRAGWTLKADTSDRDTEKADDALPSPETPSADNHHRADHPVETHAQGREAVPGGGT